MEIPGFETERTPEGDVVIARVVGRVAPDDVPRAEEAGKGLVAGGLCRMVVDLSRAEGISSTGIGLIVYYRNVLSRRGGGLVLAGPHGVVLRAIRGVKLEKTVPIFDTVDEAVAAVRKG